MRALVVYDSFYGNTEKVAQAVGQALGDGTVVLKLTEVRPEHVARADLIVVGSPTRGFRPTKPTTDLIRSVRPDGLKGVKFAAFDTRIALADANSRFLNVMVRCFGYAAGPLASRLRKKGGAAAVPPEGFFVSKTEGPLKDGELERAAAWARRMRE